MPVHRFADMTWQEVRDLDAASTVAILPVGAIEAHGPHLPLSTDVVIAEAMAKACADRLSDEGESVAILPAQVYTSAGFAAGFPGTVGVAPQAVTELIMGIAGSLAAHGFRTLALANAHLDPTHLDSLRAAAHNAPDGIKVVFLDLTRRAAAERLTEEFRTGACHAGRFEGSVIRAEAPKLYREAIASSLEPNPASLVDAIREGRTTFQDAGGPDAYFGWPADATEAEGRETVATLGELLAEAVREGESAE